MRNIDLYGHVRGESVYIDDMPLVADTLHVIVLYSSIAKGSIVKIDDTEALSLNGVHSIIYAADIPGENQIGNVIPDEPLLAEKNVNYIGQPIALILSDTPEIGIYARSLINIESLQSVEQAQIFFNFVTNRVFNDECLKN